MGWRNLSKSINGGGEVFVKSKSSKSGVTNKAKWVVIFVQKWNLTQPSLPPSTPQLQPGEYDITPAKCAGTFPMTQELKAYSCASPKLNITEILRTKIRIKYFLKLYCGAFGEKIEIQDRSILFRFLQQDSFLYEITEKVVSGNSTR